MTQATINYLKNKYPKEMNKKQIRLEFDLTPRQITAMFGKGNLIDVDEVILKVSPII